MPRLRSNTAQCEECNTEKNDGSTSSPPLSPPRPRSPLCLFYFSHPFRVGDPEESLETMSRRRRAALEAVENKRRQMLARRKKSAQLRRRVWRRYLREPFWDLKTYLFVHNTTVGASTCTASSLDEVLRTIRKAWEPPRCLSQEREPEGNEEESDMGTGRGMSRKQVLANPGLPHRRYSVPETVMRKYTLTKQRSGSGDSEVATVPVATPETISSNPLPSSSADDQSSPDTSDNGGSTSSMGNRSVKKSRSKKSPLPSETENTKSTLDTVSEEINDSIKGKASGDTLDRISSLKEDISPAPNSGNGSSKSKTSSVLEKAGKSFNDTPDSVDPLRPEYSSSQTTAGENGKITTPKLDEQSLPEPPSSERDEVTSSQTINLVSTESRPQSTPEKEENRPSPEVQEKRLPSRGVTESADEQSFAKEEMSSSLTLDVHSAEIKDVEGMSTDSVEPQTSGKNDLSSSQTLDIESTESKSQSLPNKELQESSKNTMESAEPRSSGIDDLSSSQSFGVESSENNKGMGRSPPNTAESIEPQSTVQEELSSTQTVTMESTENKSQSSSYKDKKPPSRNNSRKDMLAQNRQRNMTLKRHSSSIVVSPLDTEDTLEPKSSSRDELSSSQTMGVESTESRSSTNLNKEFQDRTSSTPGGDVSFTPTECCVSTPDPERSQSISSASDRASESCSITPMGQTSESSASGTSPERPSVTLRSSPEQPSSDHTLSTQDATLSIKSDSIILGRPVSVLARRSDSNKQPQVSDSEHSIGHIEFMNENIDNESHPFLNNTDTNCFDFTKLEKSQSTDSNSQRTGDSGHATEPDCKLGEEFCGTSKINDSESKAINPLGEAIPVVQAATNTEPVKCRHHSRAWEIIIQPTMLNNSSKCPGDGSCGMEEEPQTNKLATLPSKNLETTKTYIVIRSNNSTEQTNSKPQPLVANHDIQVPKTPISPTRTEDLGPYSWSRLTDEDRMVRLQHQRHKLWMNRKLSAANTLPSSPLHGPLSYGVGTGSSYRKSFDVQLVVPRYSALPRSVSMLVNTSSGECSSNSNSDSECLSLVDSLEEKPSSIPAKDKSTKHDSKPVRGDIIQLLPEETTSKHDLHKRVNPATPRGKGKAFFVSMAGGLDETGKVEVVENVEKPNVSQSMPDKLKKKLSQRHKQMELKKKKKKRLRGQEEDTENIPNVQKNESNPQTKLQTSMLLHNTKYPLQSVQDQVLLIKDQQTTQKEVLTQADHGTSKKPSHIRRESMSQNFTINNSNNSEQEKLGTDMPVRVRKMSTAIFYPASQGPSNGTFILSRRDGHEERPTKPSEEKLHENTSNVLSVNNMVKKEDIPEERSPPVKRFRASRTQTPIKKESALSEKDIVKNLKTDKEKEHNQEVKIQKQSKPPSPETEDENDKKLPEQITSEKGKTSLEQNNSKSENILPEQVININERKSPNQNASKNHHNSLENGKRSSKQSALENGKKLPQQSISNGEEKTQELNASVENISSPLNENNEPKSEKQKLSKTSKENEGKIENGAFPLQTPVPNETRSEKHNPEMQASIPKTTSKKKISKEHESPKSNSHQSAVPLVNEKLNSDEQISEETNSLDKTKNGRNKQSETKVIHTEKLITTDTTTPKESQSPEINVPVNKSDKVFSNQQSEVPELEKTENYGKIKKNNEKSQKTENGNEITQSSNNKIKTNRVKDLSKTIHYPSDSIQFQETQSSKKTNTNNLENKAKKESNGTSTEAKTLSNNTCQTSPQPKHVEEKGTSTRNTLPQSDKSIFTSSSSSESTSNTSKLQLQIKSGIPIMKSPIGTRKLSPDTIITFQQSLQKNSHLPVRRTSRLLHPLPVRRSANLLGTRFQQKFEVIPEERSMSLESSTEDQFRQTNERIRRASLPISGNKSGVVDRANIISHSCLGYIPSHTKYRQNTNILQRQIAFTKESSSSNYDESSSSNGNADSTNSDVSKGVTKRTSYQSRIPRAEKLIHQTKVSESPEIKELQKEEKITSPGYQGKAALAPHNEDKDLLSISKGWINFYLLKDGRGTPDSTCSEVPGDVSDKEDKLTRRKRHVPLARTVTVVGGDDNRIRQYTVPSRLSAPSHDIKRNKETSTTLPDVNSNSSSRRHSLEKLPVTVIEENSSPADSDHSTTYMCLPSPHLRQRNLLEGSGELACSESSVSSSSESECERATSPAIMPLKWPTRQLRRGPPHHRSRSRTKHYKTEQYQSIYQSGNGGSAGWTVTVAGSNACPQEPPELEMRLSFPTCARQPAASQSDSGLGEDNHNGDKSKKQLPEGDNVCQDDNEEDNESKHFLPSTQSATQTHRWTVMLKNQEISKSGKRTYQSLPDLGLNASQSKNSKKATKKPEPNFPVTSADEDTRKSKKFSALWPKVQKIIESKVIIRKSNGHISQEVKSVSQLLENDDGAIVVRSGLAIKGSAITPEKKPRVPTMSERDLTRGHTAKR